jgi:hypothetical protein
MANDLQIGGQWVTIIEFPCSHQTKSAPFHPAAEDEGPAQNRINSTSGNCCSSLSLHFNNLIMVLRKDSIPNAILHASPFITL